MILRRSLSSSLQRSISRKTYRRMKGSEVDQAYQEMREKEYLETVKIDIPKWLPPGLKQLYIERSMREYKQYDRKNRYILPIYSFLILIGYGMLINTVYVYGRYWYEVFMYGESRRELTHEKLAMDVGKLFEIREIGAST